MAFVEAVSIMCLGTAFFFIFFSKETKNKILAKILEPFSFIPILFLTGYLRVYAYENTITSAGMSTYMAFIFYLEVIIGSIYLTYLFLDVAYWLNKKEKGRMFGELS